MLTNAQSAAACSDAFSGPKVLKETIGEFSHVTVPRARVLLPPYSTLIAPRAAAIWAICRSGIFSSLYTSEDAPEIARDFDWLEQECADFATDYEGKLAGLDAAALLGCVVRYERIEQVAGRLMSYFGFALLPEHGGSRARKRTCPDAQEPRDQCDHSRFVFFSLELNRIPDADFDATLHAQCRACPLQARVRADARHAPAPTVGRVGEIFCMTNPPSGPPRGTGLV